MPNFILIDGSYYCFFRFFAIEQWFRLAKPDETIVEPSEHEVFVNKFKKTFVEKIAETIKKLKVENIVNIIEFNFSTGVSPLHV